MAEFSSAHVLLPPALARHVLDIGKSIHPDHLFTPAGQSGIEENPHVTIRQGLHDQKHLPLAKLLQRVRKPIQIKIGKMSLFPASDREWDKSQHRFDVLKFDVDSPHLHQLHSAIGESLDHTDTFPDYKPHVTVAYLKPGYGEKYLMDGHDLEGSQFASNLVHFSGRDGHEVPLSIGKMRRRFSRTARKYGRMPQHEFDAFMHHWYNQPGPTDMFNELAPVVDRMQEIGDPRWMMVEKLRSGESRPSAIAHRIDRVENVGDEYDIPKTHVYVDPGNPSTPSRKVILMRMKMPITPGTPSMSKFANRQTGMFDQDVGGMFEPHEAKEFLHGLQHMHGAHDPSHPMFHPLKKIADMLKTHFPELGEPKTGDQEHDDKQLFERRKAKKYGRIPKHEMDSFAREYSDKLNWFMNNFDPESYRDFKRQTKGVIADRMMDHGDNASDIVRKDLEAENYRHVSNPIGWDKVTASNRINYEGGLPLSMEIVHPKAHHISEHSGNIVPGQKRVKLTFRHETGDGDYSHFQSEAVFQPHEAKALIEKIGHDYGVKPASMKKYHKELAKHFPELYPAKPKGKPPSKLSRRRYEKPQMQGDAISAGHQIRSSNQAADMKIARTVIDRLGIGPAILQSVIHDVNDDAKPGVAAIIPHPVSPEKSLYSAAWHGLMANVPGQLVFHGHDDGEDRLYSMHLQGHGDNIRKALDQAGINQRQLIPVRGGYKVLVYDKGQKLRPQVGQFAETYDASVHESNGTGQYIGATANAGVDPLADSRKQYRSYIESYERANPDHPTADGIKRTEPKQVHSSAITQNGYTPVSAGTVRMSRLFSQKGLTTGGNSVKLPSRNKISFGRSGMLARYSHDEFENKIRENSDNYAHPLVYADWLEENGYPNLAKAIRIGHKVKSGEFSEDGHTYKPMEFNGQGHVNWHQSSLDSNFTNKLSSRPLIARIAKHSGSSPLARVSLILPSGDVSGIVHRRGYDLKSDFFAGSHPIQLAEYETTDIPHVFGLTQEMPEKHLFASLDGIGHLGWDSEYVRNREKPRSVHLVEALAKETRKQLREKAKMLKINKPKV